MKIADLADIVTGKQNFATLDEYILFTKKFLSLISKESNIQARIIAQNEQEYFFIQYKKDGNYQITRPINSKLFIENESLDKNVTLFNEVIRDINSYLTMKEARQCINNMIYTTQQCIGAVLDSLPGEKSNQAKKINGLLFERLIVLLLDALHFNAKTESLDIPVVHNNQVMFKMKYQHDLVLRNSSNDVKLIGAIKTTSKDRIDKVFIDKLLYSRLTSSEIYHIAIILNDVQRKKKARSPQYFDVGSTFLPGRFKGYMLKLCPLDGIYYVDIRNSMLADQYLKTVIQSFDKLIFDDLAKFID